MALTFRGMWTSDVLIYEPGDAVVHNSETWIAKERAYHWMEPGSESATSWVLLARGAAW